MITIFGTLSYPSKSRKVCVWTGGKPWTYCKPSKIIVLCLHKSTVIIVSSLIVICRLLRHLKTSKRARRLKLELRRLNLDFGGLNIVLGKLKLGFGRLKLGFLRGLILNTVGIDLLWSDFTKFKEGNDSRVSIWSKIVGSYVFWIFFRLLSIEREDNKIRPGGGEMFFVHLDPILVKNKIATCLSSEVISENPVVTSSVNIIEWAKYDVVGSVYRISSALHDAIIRTKLS